MYFDMVDSSLVSFLGRIRKSSVTIGKHILILSAVVALSELTADAANQPTYDLAPRIQEGQLTRVKTIVEVEGSLKVEKTEHKSTDLPLAVQGELFFDQRLLRIADQHAALRHYWEAKASIRVGERESESSLRKDRRLVVLSESDRHMRIHSPNGPLTRGELELLDVVGSFAFLENLLPGKPVAVNHEWQHEDGFVAQLLGLEEVTTNDLTSRLSEISARVAKINLTGHVSGSVNGVRSEIEIDGNYQFDRQSQHVKWVAMSVKESREVGLASPGFEVVARVRTIRQPTPSSPILSDNLLKQTELLPGPGDLLLDHVSDENQYRLLLDRRWFVAAERGHATVLRMLDGSDVLASCTVTRLPKLPAGKDVALEKFQSDVQQALGKHSDKLEQVSESASPNGLRLLRVVASGKAGEVPVQWFYYHLSDELGRRLSCVFTLETEIAERFAGADEALTSSVQFLPETKASGDEAEGDPQVTAQVPKSRGS